MLRQEARSYRAEQDPDEVVLDPDLEICDAHHHLWNEEGLIPYSAADFVADTQAGHRVTTSIYLECDQGYRLGGPEELRPVGETELAVRLAREVRGEGGPQLRGIVPFIDPRIGDKIEGVIDAHLEAGEGLVCGFRSRVGYDPARIYVPEGHVQWPGQMADPTYRRAVAILGRRGIPLDLIFYHTQISEAVALARAVPDANFVINHLAFPILIGRYGEHRDMVEADWRQGIASLADLPNVAMKIGGFGMRLFGHGWTERSTPASSEEIASYMAPWVDYAIERLGAARCILESNFPVDGLSFGYKAIWNAFKKMTGHYTQDERAWLFRDTALQTYNLKRG